MRLRTSRADGLRTLSRGGAEERVDEVEVLLDGHFRLRGRGGRWGLTSSGLREGCQLIDARSGSQSTIGNGDARVPLGEGSAPWREARQQWKHSAIRSGCFPRTSARKRSSEVLRLPPPEASSAQRWKGRTRHGGEQSAVRIKQGRAVPSSQRYPGACPLAGCPASQARPSRPRYTAARAKVPVNEVYIFVNTTTLVSAISRPHFPSRLGSSEYHKPKGFTR